MMLIYNSNCTLEMLMILMEIWQMAQKQNDTKAHDTVMKWGLFSHERLEGMWHVLRMQCFS